MIAFGTQSVNTNGLDYCELLSCLFIVWPDGSVSDCLRCDAPYPYTLPGTPLVVAWEDEEPFT